MGACRSPAAVCKDGPATAFPSPPQLLANRAPTTPRPPVLQAGLSRSELPGAQTHSPGAQGPWTLTQGPFQVPGASLAAPIFLSSGMVGRREGRRKGRGGGGRREKK